MKNKIFTMLIFSVMIFTSPFYAQENNGNLQDNNSQTEENLFRLNISSDFGYYPLSEMLPGENHFAPVTGPYGGVDLSTTITGSYKINTPLGQNILLSYANVLLSGGLEISPVSIRPKVTVDFSPIPLIIFSAGASFGWGWDLGSIQSLGKLNTVSYEYDKINAFSHPYYDLWAGITLQFDTGILFPGDWTHIVFVVSYQTVYSGLMGLSDNDIFMWQCSGCKARGAAYQFQAAVAYQIPLPLCFAGFMFKSAGYYDGSVYKNFDSTFDGDFAEITISPALKFQFGKKDDLTCLFDFSSRRSFESKINDTKDLLNTKVTGREWYFKRISINWTHWFF